LSLGLQKSKGNPIFFFQNFKNFQMLTTNAFVAAAAERAASNSLQYYHYRHQFNLESGGYLPELRIAYQTFGHLNADQSNVVWVFHALTANSNPLDWWKGLIGAGDLINPQEHFIICANIIGSCYGSTGPIDFNPETGERYLNTFPLLTIRDIVKAHQLLRDHLGIDKVYLGIGGSMGGQQLLEWAIDEPHFFQNIAAIACGAKSSSWGIGIRAAQRMAIEADPSFYSSSPKGGWKGLEAARAMAMVTYRSRICFDRSQVDEANALNDYRAESYQRYQGAKLNARFNARTYYTLNKAMDTHDLSRNRGNIRKALSQIEAKALIIGVESDLLFDAKEVQAFAQLIANAVFELISSDYGHDGFLIETESLAHHLSHFLNK
jgi:homoserine O-acetyltransferase